MTARVHDLKTHAPAFRAVKSGLKRFEFRANDRAFDEGDILRLREWSVDYGNYTGEELRVRVTYILTGPDYGIPKGFACMSIRPLDEEKCRRCGGMPPQHAATCDITKPTRRRRP